MIYTAKVSGEIITAKHTISGELNNNQLALTGSVAVNEKFPVYEGPYEYTPLAHEQIIEIAHHTAISNIIINPIPSNYGLITWNGSVLTVS